MHVPILFVKSVAYGILLQECQIWVQEGGRVFWKATHPVALISLDRPTRLYSIIAQQTFRYMTV